jgi:hypothetical protein
MRHSTAIALVGGGLTWIGGTLNQRGQSKTRRTEVRRDAYAAMISALDELQRLWEAAGLGEDWTPRELRHSFVSIMSDNGCTTRRSQPEAVAPVWLPQAI